MNTELLLRVRAHIEAHPEQLDMAGFECGTTHCIAGLAVVLSGAKHARKARLLDGRGRHAWAMVAEQLLGMSESKGELLFFCARWPRDLYNDYDLSRTAKARAQATLQAIDRFIACDGDPVRFQASRAKNA